jgi:hypothetical protein
MCQTVRVRPSAVVTQELAADRRITEDWAAEARHA